MLNEPCKKVAKDLNLFVNVTIFPSNLVTLPHQPTTEDISTEDITLSLFLSGELSTKYEKRVWLESVPSLGVVVAADSVTRWLSYYINIRPFRTMKICT